MADLPENGSFSLLEARHVDALTEAVRALTQCQAVANELTRRQTTAVEKLTVAVEKLTLALQPKVSEDELTAEPAVSRTASR
jgi:hypothetical protein